ncbi:MAG: hypothetical protein H5T71_05885, partial [Chloroflexi bacterium]|nr:hypothetical protein [Chloroflexota bacterium]
MAEGPRRQGLRLEGGTRNGAAARGIAGVLPRVRAGSRRFPPGSAPFPGWLGLCESEERQVKRHGTRRRHWALEGGHCCRGCGSGRGRRLGGCVRLAPASGACRGLRRGGQEARPSVHPAG